MFQTIKSSDARMPAIGVALLVGIAAALRLYGLDRWSLWLDETLQYKESAVPLNQLYLVMYQQDLPVSVLLGHTLIWAGVNDSEWQLRLPFAIFGVGIVILVFLLARELFGQRAAFLAGLAACLMPALVSYSQEYRSYSLLVFLTTLTGWALAVALRTNRAGWWALFVCAAILSLYTHFVALFFIAGMAFFAFGYALCKRQRRDPIGPIVWSGVLAFAIIGIAYVPAIPLLARLLVAEAQFFGPVSPIVRLTLLKKIVFIYPGYLDASQTIIASVAGVGVLWAAFRSPRALLFLICAFLVPALLYAFYGFARASSSARYTMLLMPTYAVALGAGLAAISFGIEALAERLRLGSGRVGVAATIALASVLVLLTLRPLAHLYTANPKPLPTDLREAFDYLRSRIKPNDLLVEASSAQGGNELWFGGYDSYYMRESAWPVAPIKVFLNGRDFPPRLAQLADMHGRLWVMITVSDAEQPNVQSAGSDKFEVQCFRRICVVQSRDAERPILEQLGKFFDRFIDVNQGSFSAPARAVRARLDAVLTNR